MNTHSLPKQLIVIGGGAAGFFCAVNAAQMNRQLKVILLEKSSKLLSKVKVSGGGRCNVTHACFDVKDMSLHYPRGQHFVRKAFHQFFTTDTIEWFESRGVKLKIEADGRMFPVSDSSQSIIDCLLREANQWGVEILMNREVEQLYLKNEKWEVRLKNATELIADFVCVASGGFPKLRQFDWLKETRHSIVEPVPSLFTFNIPEHPLNELMGVTVTDATVKIQQTKLKNTGPLLITHWGLSGPCVLKLSAWGATELHQLHYHFTLSINWLGDAKEEEVRSKIQIARVENPSKKISNSNVVQLPNRLWQFLLVQSGVTEEMRWADFPSKVQNKLIQLLINHELPVTGKTTFKEEFVTAGGIALKEVDANTMQSKFQKGLYFAGEILDVDGITGGYNFQHAWTSGYIAARSIAELSKFS